MQLDLISIVQTLLALLAGTGGTWLCTEIIKRVPWITWVSQGDTTKLRFVASIFSGIATAILAVTDKSFSPETLQGLLLDGGTWLSIWLSSHAVHKTISSTSNNEKTE